MLKIYFNNRCSTCHTALTILEKKIKKNQIEIVEYMKEKPTQKELKEILSMLGIKAEDLVRKKEILYKEKYAGKRISETQWVKILTQHPELIERPIVVKDGKAIIGRPPERILDIL